MVVGTTDESKLLAPVVQKVDNGIVQLVSLILIHWIEIYPVDSAIQLLNNWGQVKSVWEAGPKVLGPHLCTRIYVRAMIGLLKSYCQFANQVEGKLETYFQ